jgi:hypothetical protein
MDPAVEYQAPVLTLDSDETLGSWGDLSLLYNFVTITLGVTPCPVRFAEIVIATRVVRPHLEAFFERALELRKRGLIHSIALMTAASNSEGWVSFLTQTLRVWFRQVTKTDYDLTFDAIICQEEILDWNKTKDLYQKCGGIPKDLHQVLHRLDLPFTHPIIMVDDRPGAVSNATHLLRVDPYVVAVNLNLVARRFLKDGWTPSYECFYGEVFMESWREFEKRPEAFTDAAKDEVFRHLAKTLKRLVCLSQPKVFPLQSAATRPCLLCAPRVPLGFRPDVVYPSKALI